MWAGPGGLQFLGVSNFFGGLQFFWGVSNFGGPQFGGGNSNFFLNSNFFSNFFPQKKFFWDASPLDTVTERPVHILLECILVFKRIDYKISLVILLVWVNL